MKPMATLSGVGEGGRGAMLAPGLLLGTAPVVRELRTRVARIARVNSNVLISGETGTGKENVARAIHALSPRSVAPMIAVNCAALPESLLESELFGHERGAFTGAYSAYPGKLRMAEGGTVFLDEIGDMPLSAQAKVLCAIENREFFPVGGRRSCHFNARVVAATHRNLEQLVADGRFRQDLYYRINVVRVELPPLRERREDIALLAQHFLETLGPNINTGVHRLRPETLRALEAHVWPGNVRELRNVIESALVNANGSDIDLACLPQAMTGYDASHGRLGDERSLLLSTLTRTNWNKSRTAQALRWSRMKLYRKLQQYDIRCQVNELSCG